MNDTNRNFRTILHVSLVLFVSLSSCASQNSTNQITPKAWSEDVRFLAEELPKHHINAFHTVSRKTFDLEVASLNADISKLNGDEIMVRLMRIVALVGDGHTHFDLPPDNQRFPLEFQWFGDELRVVAATAAYDAAVGARVIAIGSTPIGEALERVSQLVPRGENDGRTRLTATMHFASPEVLHGLGIITDRANALFVLEVTTGERVNMNLSPAPLGNFSSWRMATGDKTPIYLRRLNESWWTEFLPDANTVYFSFTAYPQDTAFRERSASLARLLDESKAQRLVIDLRRNQGGDFQQFRQLMLPIIKSHPAINRKGGLFIITGPGTFSAASTNASDLRNEANAILVGSPTGQRPNHFGDHGEFRLPNSGYRISYSTRYHRLGADTDSAVVPDQTIEPTWAEFRAGRDPVMEWILSTKD